MFVSFWIHLCHIILADLTSFVRVVIFYKTVHDWSISCQSSVCVCQPHLDSAGGLTCPPHVNSFNSIAYAHNSQRLAQKSCSRMSWSAGLWSILECLLVIEEGNHWSHFLSKPVLSVRLVPKRNLSNTSLCHYSWPLMNDSLLQQWIVDI